MHEVEVKGILSAQNGMNLYRGCTHGCIYCDSRSQCYQINHDFEDIEIKKNAIDLLEQSLKKKRKKCMIGTGSMCDPYMHVVETVGNTRKALQLIAQYGFGLAIQTKSSRILRDLYLLKEINEKSKCVVQITLTTFDDDLARILEPKVSTTSERFEVLKTMRDNGIPTIVWISPILPFINDTVENMEGLLRYCVEAKVKGILCFRMGLTLREGNREYFYKKLDEDFPGMKNQYIKKFGNAYECKSDREKELLSMIEKVCKENNMLFGPTECFEYLHTFEEKAECEQIRFPWA